MRIADRQEYMGQFLEFAEILEQRIRQQILSEKPDFQKSQQTKNVDFPSENPSNSSTSPKTDFGFAWVLAHTERAESSNSRGKSAYGVKARPRPPHKMDPLQTLAYCYFRSQIPSFGANFTRGELQKSFRLLAKKLHPDAGGTSEDFIVLKTQHDLLASVFRQASEFPSI